MKIFSIIVSYNPEIKNLLNLSKVLIRSNSVVIIVDNTEKSYISHFNDFSACTLIILKENKGIAYAQNIGIRYALDSGADAIVFFDQDSVIEDNFLSSLVSHLKIGEPKVVAPIFYDNSEGFEFPSFRLSRFGLLKKVYKKQRVHPYPVDVIISSGSAATKETFEQAGLMDEDFFIDFVDFEWAIRCRKINIHILVVPTAIMQHTIGEKSFNFGMFRGFIHSPTRSYYKLRNAFLLLRKRNIPILAASKEIVSALIHQALLIFFSKNKLLYIRNYFLAILHGILGVVGKKAI